MATDRSTADRSTAELERFLAELAGLLPAIRASRLSPTQALWAL